MSFLGARPARKKPGWSGGQAALAGAGGAALAGAGLGAAHLMRKADRALDFHPEAASRFEHAAGRVNDAPTAADALAAYTADLPLALTRPVYGKQSPFDIMHRLRTEGDPLREALPESMQLPGSYLGDTFAQDAHTRAHYTGFAGGPASAYRTLLRERFDGTNATDPVDALEQTRANNLEQAARAVLDRGGSEADFLKEYGRRQADVAAPVTTPAPGLFGDLRHLGGKVYDLLRGNDLADVFPRQHERQVQQHGSTARLAEMLESRLPAGQRGTDYFRAARDEYNLGTQYGNDYGMYTLAGTHNRPGVLREALGLGPQADPGTLRATLDRQLDEGLKAQQQALGRPPTPEEQADVVRRVATGSPEAQLAALHINQNEIPLAPGTWAYNALQRTLAAPGQIAHGLGRAAPWVAGAGVLGGLGLGGYGLYRYLQGRRGRQKKADFAPGLPTRKHYGDLSRLTPGQLLDYVVQHHKAHRAGPHYDVRIGSRPTGMYSWAAPKGVPVPGEKNLAVRQPLHRHSYNTFEGTIPRGYGAGTVRTHESGQVLVTKAGPDHIHFTTAHRRHPERFVLLRPKGFGKPHDWLLFNVTPTEKVPFEKLRYKRVPAEQVEGAIRNMGEGGSVEAKVDGASQLVHLLKGHAEHLSFRTSKETGRPIVHTERVFGCFDPNTPVRLETGDIIPIGRVQVGDHVESDGCFTPVTAVFDNGEATDWLSVSAGASAPVIVTPNHGFMVAGLGCVPIGLLEGKEAWVDGQGEIRVDTATLRDLQTAILRQRETSGHGDLRTAMRRTPGRLPADETIIDRSGGRETSCSREGAESGTPARTISEARRREMVAGHLLGSGTFAGRDGRGDRVQPCRRLARARSVRHTAPFRAAATSPPAQGWGEEREISRRAYAFAARADHAAERTAPQPRAQVRMVRRDSQNRPPSHRPLCLQRGSWRHEYTPALQALSREGRCPVQLPRARPLCIRRLPRIARRRIDLGVAHPQHLYKIGGFLVHNSNPKFHYPRHLEGSVLKGELYSSPEVGKANGPQDVGTLLNSSVARSLQLQREQGVKIRNMVYDIQQYGNKPVGPDVPRPERRKMMEEIAGHLPPETFHTSEPVHDPEKGVQLWRQIAAGRHPMTREGVVIHPAQGVPLKGKLTDEHDVYITGTFPGEGKRALTVGGFTYGHEAGKAVGKVGSGFTDKFLDEVARDPHSFVGRVARIKAQEKLPSGALRAPVFMALHEDVNKIPKPNPPIKVAHEQAEQNLLSGRPDAVCDTGGPSPPGLLRGSKGDSVAAPLGGESHVSCLDPGRAGQVCKVAGTTAGMAAAGLKMPDFYGPDRKPSWTKHVMTHYDSTKPPRGIFTRSADEIVAAGRDPQVAPLGPASWQRMVLFHRNRGGARLGEERRAVLQEAIRQLSEEIQRAKTASIPVTIPYNQGDGKIHNGDHDGENARPKSDRDLPNMGRHAAALRESAQPSVSSVRRQGDQSLSSLAEVRELLGGHGRATFGSDHRARRRQQGLFTGQLSLVTGRAAGPQSHERAPHHIQWQDSADERLGQGNRHSGHDTLQPARDRSLASAASLDDHAAYIQRGSEGPGTRRISAQSQAMGPTIGRIAHHDTSPTQGRTDDRGRVDDSVRRSQSPLRPQGQYPDYTSGKNPLTQGLGRSATNLISHSLYAASPGLAAGASPGSAKEASFLSGVSPAQHQQKRVADRVNSYDPRMLVYHGLGSGKSRASIMAAETSGEPYAAIVPASLRPNFVKEQERWTDMKTPSSVLSYTQVGMGQAPAQRPRTLILDEAQRLRNPNSAATQGVKQLASQADRVMLLSGTPIVNQPNDLAVPLSLLTGEDVDPKEFDRRFVGKKEVSPGLMGWLQGVKPVKVPTIQHEDELEDMLRGHVDYHPSKTPEGVHTNEERVVVDMSPQQKDFYRLMWNQLPWLTRWKMKHDYPMTPPELKNLQSFMTGPRQAALSLYPFQQAQDPMRAFQESAKLQAAFKNMQSTLAGNPQAKVLAYSNFIDAGLTPYEAALKANKIPYSILHGKLNDQERKAQLDAYNQGKSRVLLLGPSAAEGISAQGTQLIQLLDPHWNEARMGQAQGRGLRFDSHEGLPEELRNVKIQRYIARMPEPGFFGRLFGGARRPSADEFLEAQSHRKEELNNQFRDTLKRVGSEPPTTWWGSLFG